MEENRVKQYRPSTGEKNMYYHETSAVNNLASFDSSAVKGNLADLMKSGPVSFPNSLAPNTFRHIPLARSRTMNSTEAGEH